MSRSTPFFVLAVVALHCVASAATQEQIKQVIEKSKQFLYDQQREDGTWEAPFFGHGDQKTGQTALAVCALLAAGEPHTDPRLVKAIDYLKKTPTTGVYALGLRCQVWLTLPHSADVRAAMMKDSRILVESMKAGGIARGMYDYNPRTRWESYSHSRSQYGVLGCWAAAQTGVEIPREYWVTVERAWMNHQEQTGGWAYTAGDGHWAATPGMTAVGIATLYITQDYVHISDGMNCTGNVRNPAIERGMKWMVDHFDMVGSDKRYPRDFPTMTLYAVERIGAAGGIKYFGDYDWYQKGADYFVRNQADDGSFDSDLEFDVKIAGSAFSLLFLSHGSAPMVMNKLDYSSAGKYPDEMHWNQRPRDVANEARWIGQQSERELNWQTVNLSAPLDDLFDAPILYRSGNTAIKFNAEEEAKIQQFVEEGGLVLGNADCGNKLFANSFRELGQKLFSPYEFRTLPDEHVIFTNEQFPRSKWKRKPTVLALGNGARELMILIPDSDAAKAWQSQVSTGKEELFQLGADIYQYSVDKTYARRRGETYRVKWDEQPKSATTLPATTRATTMATTRKTKTTTTTTITTAVATTRPAPAIKLARLEYSGNFNPEPGGWRRLAAVMHNAGEAELTVEPVKLGAGQLAAYKLAHLTGTVEFHLDDAARAEIRQFLDAGGTLIVDAAGGSSEFAVAAEKELAAVVPDAGEQLKAVIPLADPLYTAGGYALEPVAFRNFARTRLGNVKTPQLRAIRIKGRIAIIFSREDLSVGLVGEPVDGIVGYAPETATRLMRRVICFSLTLEGAVRKSP